MTLFGIKSFPKDSHPHFRGFFIGSEAAWIQLTKWHTLTPQVLKMMYIKRVKRITPMIVDPRFEDEALSALMEEAFSQTEEETKFDVDAYFNSNIDY